MKNYNYSKRYKDNINKINNTTRKNIVSVKIKPRNNNAENSFGGKIREKNNYTLYVSGNKPYYFLYPKEIQFKVNKDKNPKKLQNNKSFIIYRDKNHNNYLNPITSENILDISENYGYKESRNVTYDDKNKKIQTSNNIKENSSKMDSKTTNIIKNYNNLKIFKRDFNKYSENNQGIKIIKADKSSDNLLKNRINYRLKINNEAIPNNHKSKIIKVAKTKEGYLKEIYQKKYVKQNNYMNYTGQPKTIKDYYEEDSEPIKYYRYNNNITNYNINSSKNQNFKNKYFINNNYDCNEYNFKNNYIYNNEVFGDDESKNITCPLHGNISMLIHKNHGKVNKL